MEWAATWAACSVDCLAVDRAPAAAQQGGLASVLDLDGDGNPLDDILEMAGKMMR